MGAFDMLGIANSSLGMHQTWLDALANNIANANDVTSTDQDAFQAQYVRAQARPEEPSRVAGRGTQCRHVVHPMPGMIVMSRSMILMPAKGATKPPSP